jgi:2,4-dienoyl-CoA reductase-like NADH-dependent reductase (Old Yellow Enzyme family)
VRFRSKSCQTHAGSDRCCHFGGVLIANEGFDLESAQQVIAAGEADAVSFGKLFISNPDLPRRLQLYAPQYHFHHETYYGYGLHDTRIGYTDYTSLVGEVV